MSEQFPRSADERLKLLTNVRVVLVDPKFPGNLGMTARVMKNCGFSDLRLVRPRAELNKEAYTLAPTGAEILDTARFHDELEAAVADCGLVVGSSRRRGVLRRNVVSPEEFGELLRPALPVNRVAVVFGSEDCGLNNDDLSRCHWIVSMHTGSKAESFNLSHSVAILLYTMNRAVFSAEDRARKLASSKNQESMFADIGRFLLEIGFIHEKDPKRMMMVMRQILHRSGLTEREVRILRGVIRQCRWRIQNPDAPLDPRDTPQWMRKQKS